MKKCPFCAEEIQEQAVKCKHCGEFLNQETAAGIAEDSDQEKILARDFHPSVKMYLGYMLLGIALLIVVVGFFILVWVLLDWISTVYCITDKRIRTRRGILSKRIDEVKIAHIRSINIRQGLLGLLLNYGNVYIGTAGTEGVEIVLTGVSDPSKIKELIAGPENTS